MVYPERGFLIAQPVPGRRGRERTSACADAGFTSRLLTTDAASS
ncbi:hypothetical protein SVIOM342S_03580 [Streptomyces violaceorubidus]